MTDKPKRRKAYRGSNQCDCSPFLKAKASCKMFKDLCDIVKMPLMPWQEYPVKDMLTVDKKGSWIRRNKPDSGSTAERQDSFSAYVDIGTPD